MCIRDSHSCALNVQEIHKFPYAENTGNVLFSTGGWTHLPRLVTGLGAMNDDYSLSPNKEDDENELEAPASRARDVGSGCYVLRSKVNPPERLI